MRLTCALSFWITPLLFIALCCSTPARQQSASGLITSTDELSGKSFQAAIEGANSASLKDVATTVIFHKDTTGLIRLVKGSTMLNTEFSWQFIGDSLLVTEINNSTTSANKVAPPTYYAVTKEANGYLLKGKEDQMLLTLIK